MREKGKGKRVSVGGMRRYLRITVLIIMLGGGVALAAVGSAAQSSAQSSTEGSPPIPPRKYEQRSQIDQSIKENMAQQKDLKQKTTLLESDLKNLKKNIIAIAEQVQEQEKQSYELEQRLEQLKTDKANLTQSLEKQKKSIADLLLAMERIKRLPPETLIARPDAPLQTAQAATVLSTILPELDRRSKKLRLDLEDLGRVESELTTKQERLSETLAQLKDDQAKLDALMKTHEKTLKSARAEMAKREQSIAELSKSANNIDELIKKVDARNRELEQQALAAQRLQEQKALEEAKARARKLQAREQARDQAKALAKKQAPQGAQEGDFAEEEPMVAEAPVRPKFSTQAALTPIGPMGTGRLPVQGMVKIRYGESDEIGAISQGITIVSRPSSVVVAPFGGVVRYAGPFKKYGTIILMEHKNHYHSLVAGLGKIDAFVGQSVEAGEPLGRLPDYSGRLYYELRLNGNPINPARQIAPGR